MRRAWWLLLWCAACGNGAARWSVATTVDGRVPLSAWAASPASVYMVGGSVGGPNPASLFLHRDGGSFGEIAAGTDATLWWIWGTSDHDIWLVGERGTVLRYDGVRTRALAVPPEAAQATLFGVWGSSSDDVWIVGGVPDVRAWCCTLPAIR